MILKCDICGCFTFGKKYPIHRPMDMHDYVMVRLCRKCRRKPINELKHIVYENRFINSL